MSDEFAFNSRYRGVNLRTRTLPDGSTETYVGRRIIPATGRYQANARHKVIADDRIDRIAAEAFGDPEQYWKICDANGDADPAHAAEPDGRLLIIPLPLEISDHGEP
ncbi:MAG TPA: hypothetical protein VGB08_05465 [Allosphingosinicella sp.]|jgi:hypothetical protein